MNFLAVSVIKLVVLCCQRFASGTRKGVWFQTQNAMQPLISGDQLVGECMFVHSCLFPKESCRRTSAIMCSNVNLQTTKIHTVIDSIHIQWDETRCDHCSDYLWHPLATNINQFSGSWNQTLRGWVPKRRPWEQQGPSIFVLINCKPWSQNQSKNQDESLVSVSNTNSNVGPKILTKIWISRAHLQSSFRLHCGDLQIIFSGPLQQLEKTARDSKSASDAKRKVKPMLIQNK